MISPEGLSALGPADLVIRGFHNLPQHPLIRLIGDLDLGDRCPTISFDELFASNTRPVGMFPGLTVLSELIDMTRVIRNFVNYHLLKILR